VILHGLFGWKRNWAGLMAKFAETHHVYATDARNHGESPHVPGMVYGEMANDLIHFIEQRIGGPARVMGHSMGGKTSMVAALARPDLFERLIVGDIAPVSYGHAYHSELDAMKAMDVGAMTRRQDADEALATSIPGVDVRGLLLQNLVRAEEGGFRWRINLDAIADDHDQLIEFPEIPKGHVYEGPMLFIRGGNSNYVSDAQNAEINRLFPAAKIETVEGAGHWLHAEKPGEFFAAAQGFLES
jgi:esterase